ncbi:uncharacterized protein LOC126811636 isoform X2 [Patella vulgata]|uniref:uncharacterized protein LOC126811636 isoform X2 n=1 Tax=Patella vulgata TaxID=6465 RepID=UPI00217FC5CA|nr:uncharacterized protein LOC126811636 isoform X2 [Patella vulgata]
MKILQDLVTSERCPTDKGPVVNMCSNSTQGGSSILLDINIQPTDNFNSCSCTLKLIRPEVGTGRIVSFNSTTLTRWCSYNLTLKTKASTGRYNCDISPKPLPYNLQPNGEVNIFLQKHNGSDFTRCLEIQSSETPTELLVECSPPTQVTPSTTMSTEETTSGDDMIFSSTDSFDFTTLDPSTNPPVGAIIGGLFGVVAVIGLAVIGVCLWRRHKSKRMEDEDPTYNTIGPEDAFNISQHGSQNPPIPLRPSGYEPVTSSQSQVKGGVYENSPSKLSTSPDQAYESLTSSMSPSYENIAATAPEHGYESLRLN